MKYYAPTNLENALDLLEKLSRSYWITAKSGKNLRTAKQPEHPRKKSAQKCSQAVGGVHGQHNQSRLGFCRATQVCQYSV